MRLDGRRALVTGGGSGIGRASAVRMAAEGARVFVTDVRDGLAREAAAEVGGSWAHCDVASEGDVADATARAADALGGIDVLVAAAGIATPGLVHELSLEDWDLVLRVNLTGMFLSAKHAIPHMLDAGRGSIVTIGSVSSVVIGAGGSAASYKASKGGVLQLTRALAVDYAANDIRANCVCPGAVATNLGRHSAELRPALATAAPSPPVKITIEAPIHRRADPSEIASVVAFLASDDASFITGAAVMADGGYTAI